MEKKRDQEDEELKHVCKLCNKRYPSGKSLGGHMRSHVIASRNNNINVNNHNNKPISILSSIPKKSANLDYVSDENNDDENGGKISGYGLRENPKKTWRLVDSTLLNNTSYKQLQFQKPQERERERVCRQCGKGFNSLKALCGHMSSHSEKEKGCFKDDEEDDEDEEEEDNSWSSDSKNHHLISTMESENSDNNNNNRLSSKRRTRSCLSRYSSLTPSPPTTTNGGGASSSNHSEIDQHEQEEVAMCLMMLSRDSSGFNNNNNNQKGCFHFTAESSDNNSVILEGGSSTDHVGILRFKGDNKVIKQVVVVAAKEEEEEEINVIGNDDNNHHEIIMDNSDSGYFENGAKELESDDSVDGFVRNYDGFKKPKVEFGSCFYDDDSGKRERIRGGLVGNYSRFDSNNPESEENSSKKMKIKKKMMIKEDYYGCMKKGSKYECWVCNKTFKTHQALGGHVISHRKNGDNSFIDTSITNNNARINLGKKNLVGVSSGKIMGNTSSATTSSKSKKVKGHKCPYCTRVFKSGQALGGHKRSHMMGAGRGVVKMEEKPRLERPVLPPPMPEPEQHQHQQAPMIDLNLPAPMEEEGNSQFVAW